MAHKLAPLKDALAPLINLEGQNKLTYAELQTVVNKMVDDGKEDLIFEGRRLRDPVPVNSIIALFTCIMRRRRNALKSCKT
jgi:hypothetical protein